MQLEIVPTSDLELLVGLETLIFPEEAWSERDLVSHLEAHEAWILCQEGKPIAYSLLCKTPWEIEIFRLGTHPNFRNQGHAQSLLKSLFSTYPHLDFFFGGKGYKPTSFAVVRFRRFSEN